VSVKLPGREELGLVGPTARGHATGSHVGFQEAFLEYSCTTEPQHDFDLVRAGSRIHRGISAVLICGDNRRGGVRGDLKSDRLDTTHVF